MLALSLPSKHRNDDRRAGAFALGADGRQFHACYSVAAVPSGIQRRRHLSADRRTRPFLLSFAGHSLTREGDRLDGPLLPCWAGRHKFLTPAGRRLSAVFSARLFAGFIPQGEIPCTDPRHQLASNLTDGSRAFHPQSRLSCVGGSDVDHSTRRHLVNGQFIVGEIRNV